jgi:hypothetical protein
VIGFLMCVTSFAAGCVFMKARQLRKREVADTDRQDVKRILGGLHSRPLVGYPTPLSPRDFDGMVVPPLREAAYTPALAIDWYRNEHQPLSRGWWVEKAQRLGTRVLRAAEPVMEPPAIGTAHVRLPIEAGPGKHRAAPSYSPGDFTLDLREYGLDIRTYQEVS